MTKRNAVKMAYRQLLEQFEEFSISHVKTVFGEKLIRICCRTFEQLQNISAIMKSIFQNNLIEEVGMPLEHSYKMKTLVMFVRPVDERSRNEILFFFTQNVYNFTIHQIDFSGDEEMKENSSEITPKEEDVKEGNFDSVDGMQK